MSNESERMTLRDWRKRRFLTQAELAELVGVTHFAISNWENGIKMPRPSHIRGVAAALGIKPEQIILPEQRGKGLPAVA